MSDAKKLKLYLISQTQADGYDTYDSAVVCAESEDQARNVDPSEPYIGGGGAVMTRKLWKDRYGDEYALWCSGPEHVTVKYIGEAAPGLEIGVICASFNAG